MGPVKKDSTNAQISLTTKGIATYNWEELNKTTCTYCLQMNHQSALYLVLKTLRGKPPEKDETKQGDCHNPSRTVMLD